MNAVVGSVTWEQIVVKEMIVLKEAWHTGESAPVRVKRCRMDRKSVRASAVSWGFASLRPKAFPRGGLLFLLAIYALCCDHEMLRSTLVSNLSEVRRDVNLQ